MCGVLQRGRAAVYFESLNLLFGTMQFVTLYRWGHRSSYMVGTYGMTHIKRNCDLKPTL